MKKPHEIIVRFFHDDSSDNLRRSIEYAGKF